MDSTAVKKLIRSQLWPLLKRQGFEVFEFGSVFRYRDPFIDVVDFQFFNQHLASGLGCTTYSFAMNLGVYVRGSEHDDYDPPDEQGRLHPHEAACSFRGTVEKRCPVDKFERLDVFYMDQKGETAGPCFRELEHLTEFAIPSWFENFRSLDAALEKAEDLTRISLESGARFKHNVFPKFGSWAYSNLMAMLRLLDFERDPGDEKAVRAFGEVERLADATLDIARSLDEPRRTEFMTERIRNLVRRLRADPHGERPGLRDVALPSQDAAIAAEAAPIDCRKELWPRLREHGFTEFTDRLAHRILDGHVEAIEIVSVDSSERKQRHLGGGLFRVGLGIFWPELGASGQFRVAKGQARPKVAECHIRTILLSKLVSPAPGATSFTLFQSVEAAYKRLEEDGLPWLDRLGDSEACLAFIQSTALEWFDEYPMMRGLGGRKSCLRHLARALLAKKLHRMQEVAISLSNAEIAAAESTSVHLRPRLQELVGKVRANL